MLIALHSQYCVSLVQVLSYGIENAARDRIGVLIKT